MPKTKADYFDQGVKAYTNGYAGSVIPPKSGWQKSAWDEGFRHAADEAAVPKAVVTATAVKMFRSRAERDSEKRLKATLAKCSRIIRMSTFKQPKPVAYRSHNIRREN